MPGDGTRFMLVTLGAPVVKFVGRGRDLNIECRLIRAGNHDAVVGINRERLTAAVHLRLPFPYNKKAHDAIRVHPEPINAVAQ